MALSKNLGVSLPLMYQCKTKGCYNIPVHTVHGYNKNTDKLCKTCLGPHAPRSLQGQFPHAVAEFGHSFGRASCGTENRWDSRNLPSNSGCGFMIRMLRDGSKSSQIANCRKDDGTKRKLIIWLGFIWRSLKTQMWFPSLRWSHRTLTGESPFER